MDFDFPLIFAGLVFSSVGLVYFSYGRRMKNLNLLFCGMALMVYPYFVDKMVVTIVIGAALSGMPFFFRWW
jgi:hypothetical protein